MPANPTEKKAIATIGARAQLFSETGEEDSKVIEQRATDSIAAADSTPPRVKGLVAVLKLLPAWQRGIFLMGLLGLVGYAVGHGFKFW